MKVLNGYSSLKKYTKKNTVLTIGNFDGIHKGHQKIIKEAVKISKNNNLKSVVITFKPHPNEFFKRVKAPFKLTNDKIKILEIDKLGVDYLIFLKFDKNFNKQSPERFIKKLIFLNPKHIVVGYNFYFGYKRKGDTNLLKKLSNKYLYKLKIINPVVGDNNKVFNSTLIRKNLELGKYESVKKMLGRNWLLEGKVIKGSGRGKELGYPTANFIINDYVQPMKGVYITKSFLKNNKKGYFGIANIGNRPTFNEKKIFFENHFFNVKDFLYGRTIFVELLAFLRKEKKFANIKVLKNQIKKDILLAKKILKNYK
tara:strand:- start:2244 stop:3179 length:936 start_codon:yes stop_codon:yes gene_type:complete